MSPRLVAVNVGLSREHTWRGHNCEVALIGGSVTYDPDPLDPPAIGNLLICCSRPQGDVVIDL